MRALPAAAMAAFRADAAVRNQQDAETAADVPMAMAYLDRCGATFEQVPG